MTEDAEHICFTGDYNSAAERQLQVRVRAPRVQLATK
jgi:hypothetical protein